MEMARDFVMKPKKLRMLDTCLSCWPPSDNVASRVIRADASEYRTYGRIFIPKATRNSAAGDTDDAGTLLIGS